MKKLFANGKGTLFKKFTKKKLIILAVILVIAIALIVPAALSRHKKQEDEILTAVVDVGDIEVIISGTGTVEPNDSYEVTSLVKGEIINAPFEEGTIVEKGDLLYQIDTADVENSIERSKISVEKSRNSYNQNAADLANLSVRSEAAGSVTAIYVKKGDNISANTKIADVIDSGSMTLTTPFISEHAQQIAAGDLAEITLQKDGSVLYGTVKKVTSGEILSNTGVQIKNVEIFVENPGNIREGDRAAAIVGDVSCTDLGQFSYQNSAAVVAKVSGKVENILCSEGDYVRAGDVVARLSSSTLEQNYKNSSLSLKESQLSLENQYDQLDNYNITSPISGTVIQKNSKQGDTLDNTNSTTVMATIADMSKILFDMSVDELDISKIQVGQTVLITADALEDQTFTGYVDAVSIIGTSSNGVTTYPVTIVINDPEGLIPGMNVSADIIVEKKENVVRIPVSALKRGNRVAVQLKDGEKIREEEPKPGKEKMPSSMMMLGKASDGFKLVTVKIGLSNEDYIEILEGISEGDVVQVTAEQVVTTSGFPMVGIPGGMGGMPSSGGMGTMPGGGMPSGGMGGMPGGSRPSGGGMPSGGMSGGR